jgi:hypothetical protein
MSTFVIVIHKAAGGVARVIGPFPSFAAADAYYCAHCGSLAEVMEVEIPE